MRGRATVCERLGGKGAGIGETWCGWNVGWTSHGLCMRFRGGGVVGDWNCSHIYSMLNHGVCVIELVRSTPVQPRVEKLACRDRDQG